ncbi:hypothetical protein Sjap_015055 [Stephania japonica]|uniref:Zinc-finger domain-containing protein n=1 Tax=Stephania japonica TaxID=461633 RepID=A0AAP0NR11_9MAGN
MDFAASCKNQKDDKACSFRFCYKCLLNRYGEKAEEMELLGDWKCPKCRGICNCSFCMKRRGHQPTGILAHTAKATGFSSVSEMLQVQGPESISVSPRKLPSTKVLDLKEGFPESVLYELMHGCGRRRGQYSSIVQFRNQLLGLIQQETGQKSLLTTTTDNGDSWAQGLCKCMFDSHYALKEFPFDCFDIHGEGYKKLDTTKKLRLLNFLCDEALGTENLRSWIDEQNSKVIERRKKAKEKVLAAKEKERGMKRKMQNKIAKAILLKNGAPLQFPSMRILF